ncbi:6669_t:CDS:10 [Scutellospora calospora]|uniref:6669_t:CDS:1 n=1 Tax=Scutellospora calospora TaxID=85575 RepID=A0ACA9KB74_9GLOM|nr:6669_t:CDS:10 [Scutellospora calospora]
MSTAKVIKDLSINLHLTMPPSNASFTIHLKEGQLLLDTVRHFMDENNIPCYLEISIMSVIDSLMEESRRIKLEKDIKINDESKAKTIKEELIAKYQKYTVRFNDTPSENIFPKAFHTLVHSPIPSIFDTLSQLEQDYKHSIKESMILREKEKANIDERHLKEREKHQKEVESMVESGSADAGFAKLIERQVEESEFNQAAWESELEEIQRTQKCEYWDFVLKLYEEHQRCLTEQQSSTDPVCLSRLDGKMIVSEVISDMKNQKKVSKELLRLTQGNTTRSRPGSIGSMSEMMLSMTPQSPVYASPSEEKKLLMFAAEDDPDVLQIKEMGFSSEQATVALEMTNRDKEQAISLLLDQAGKVDAQIAQRRPSVPVIPAPKETSVPHRRSKSNSKPLVLSVLTKQEKKNNVWSPMSFIQQQKSSMMAAQNNSSMRKFSGWLVGKAMENFGLEDDEHGPVMQFDDEHQLVESFTISLGNQVKSTHNLRLLASDIDDLLRSSNDQARDVAYRAQTAADLYSQNLTAIVLLLTPKDWPNYKLGKSANKAFFERCKESTEFHFDNVENQFEAIEKDFIASESDGVIPVKEDCFSDSSITENVLHKRAELVLKCIRGFMFENSWIPKCKADEEDGTKTVTFLLPKNVNEQQFQSHRLQLTDNFRAN